MMNSHSSMWLVQLVQSLSVGIQSLRGLTSCPDPGPGTPNVILAGAGSWHTSLSTWGVRSIYTCESIHLTSFYSFLDQSDHRAIHRARMIY